MINVFLDLLDFLVLLDDGRLVDLLVNGFLLLDDRRLVMVVHALRMRMRVLVVLLFDGNMNDDLLFLDVTIRNKPNIFGNRITHALYIYMWYICVVYPPSAIPIAMISTTIRPVSS